MPSRRQGCLIEIDTWHRRPSVAAAHPAGRHGGV